MLQFITQNAYAAIIFSTFLLSTKWGHHYILQTCNLFHERISVKSLCVDLPAHEERNRDEMRCRKSFQTAVMLEREDWGYSDLLKTFINSALNLPALWSHTLMHGRTHTLTTNTHTHTHRQHTHNTNKHTHTQYCCAVSCWLEISTKCGVSPN